MDAPRNTAEVKERHRFDVGALATWMEVGDLEVRQFRGGQSNPTYWISDGQQCWVLRKKPPGKLLPSAHQVEREARVMRALADTDVPVAAVHALCEDPSVIGTPFFLMEHVGGRIFWNVQLHEQTPAERAAIYDELARVLAAIHSVDLDAVGLRDFGKPDRYVERQIQRWSAQYQQSETSTIAAMDNS